MLLSFLSIFLFIGDVLSVDTRSKPKSPRSCDDSRECENGVLEEAKAKCFGHYGCSSATITVPDGTICSGSYGCMGASISSGSFVACTGFKGCVNAQEITAKSANVLCSGMLGCESDVAIKALSGNVRCDGFKSCINDDIEATGGSAWCVGKKSCVGSYISSDQNVECNGDTSCSGAIIDAANDVSCYGKKVCKDATIVAGDSVNAFGAFGAKGATITAPNVRAMGFSSLADATVDSDGLDTMVVESYGDRATVGATIICRSGATCTLQCKSIACRWTIFECEQGAKCDVYPQACQDQNNQVFVKRSDGVFCPYWETDVAPSELSKNIESIKADLLLDAEFVSVLTEESDGIEQAIEFSIENEAKSLENKWEKYELEMMDYDYEENENSYLFGAYVSSPIITNSTTYSHLITASITVILSFIIANLYFKKKYNTKDIAYQPLL